MTAFARQKWSSGARLSSSRPGSSTLVTVVPLSTTAPNPVCDFHCILALAPPLPPPFDSREVWVKADMLATVAFSRLDLPRTRSQFGQRKYLNMRLKSDQLSVVYQCVLHAIGLGHLTSAIQ